MLFREWAHKWGIPFNAVIEWERANGVAPEEPTRASVGKMHSEAWVQSNVFLEAPRAGFQFFRNNVGAYIDKQGRQVRYGLANESAKQNDVIKSGDLVGWQKFLIQPHHVGLVIPRFASVECKEVGWQYSGNGREPAQLTWGNLITANGGFFKFVNRPGMLSE